MKRIIINVKVTGMSVGQVAQLMSEGVEFYRHEAGNRLVIDTSRAGIFIGSNTASMDLGSLRMELKDGKIYRKIEAPWWEKYVGRLVMVRDYSGHDWEAKTFKKYDEKDGFKFVDRNGTHWGQMRPLTAAEKDAIITEN